MNVKKWVIGILCCFILVTILFMMIKPAYLTWEYIARCIKWGDSDVWDYEKFHSREIANGDAIFTFQKDIQEEKIAEIIESIEYSYKGKSKQIEDVQQFLESTRTTAFIVIKDDTIIYEKYPNGYHRDSINTSFSMAKSFTSALIGIAVDEGFISSIAEPISNYIPELKSKGLEQVTIKDLLLMSSGISYKEGLLFFGDDAKTYYHPDLRKLALQEVRLIDKPGEYFLYNNYHPLLLGMILERATGMSVSAYLEEKIWKPLGMEYPASWSLDSEAGFEKMESGINARAIDYAKFGRLFLRQGQWEGTQIISKEWVRESTQAPETIAPEYYTKKLGWENFYNPSSYYKYQWWGYKQEQGLDDFYAWGKYGQVIYVAPNQNLIIVRTGEEDGEVDEWPEILREIANRIAR